MLKKTDFYIDGKWVPPYERNDFPIINPSNEEAFATISLGSKRDLDDAVIAAKNAFTNWSVFGHKERLIFIRKLLSIYEDRTQEMAEAISSEMGAPIKLAKKLKHLQGQTILRPLLKPWRASNLNINSE